MDKGKKIRDKVEIENKVFILKKIRYTRRRKSFFGERKRNMKSIEDMKDKMLKADAVLIGIGKELSFEQIEKNPEEYIKHFYLEKNDRLYEMLEKKENKTEDEKYIFQILKEKAKLEYSSQKVYEKLSQLLQDKNYFVITTNTDGIIFQSDLEKDRIVAPCGDIHRLQCKKGCSDELLNTKEVYENIINQYKEKGTVSKFNCSHCGQELMFNVRNNETIQTYREEGYLKQWEVYTKWLSKTLNQKLLILEIGENIEQPNLIRWPFEKVAFLNLKSYFVRVNQSLYQIEKEIAGRGEGIKCNGVHFLNCELEKTML